VAIKITRNTEIDHKFAGSESKLLNYLMTNDPNDSHNVVRLINEFYFRDHHCFVFELLCSDLFEHLKENGFIGFEVTKIRDYAI
jgi:dual specificity tyrosine-phosphorylation-regulated kinase 2/3/4